MKKLVIMRRISQAFFLIVFVYILWSTTYPLTGLLPSDTFFKADPLIMIATSISERLILPGIEFAFLAIVLTLILGRFFCGWICPLGTAIDMVGSIGRKVHPEDDAANRKARKAKFIILGVTAFFAALGIQIAWVLDPMVIAARFVSLNLIPSVTFILNSIFVLLIKDFGIAGPVRDLYHLLKSSLLGVKVYYFSHSFIILCFFLAVCAVFSLIKKRLWCRAICPLGAIYALAARFSLLTRVIGKCTHCMACKPRCRTGAILDDASYVKGECILCMDCIYDCPQRVTAFKLVTNYGKAVPEKPPAGGISRGQFLSLVGLPVVLSLMPGPWRKRAGETTLVIRPPAALKESDFLDRCIRCSNCMKVCITNGLQPVLFQTGIEGIWTPQLVPEIGYCEYNCTLCGNTCPTGAIPRLSLEQKQKTRLGLAVIDRSLCLPWARGEQYIVCEEHCPVYNKAIKLVREGALSKPYVDKSLCIGCGICQNKCPVRPARAVRVSPARSDRT